MKVKKYIAILLIFFVVLALSPNETFAAAPVISDITSGMSNVGNATTENSKIFNILNAVIKLIQVAGSGVAVIVVTMLRHKIYAGKFVRKSRY